jgi:transmembrane sensor
MTEEEQARELLKKYQAKGLDTDGIKKVEEWYASFEENPVPINKDRKAAIREDMFAELQKVMDMQPKPKIFNWPSITRITSAAAAVLIILGIGIIFWQPAVHKTPQEKLFFTSTDAGEHKKITLSDGSEIWLNPSSRISYQQEFSAANRTIELTEGEAFFKIAHEKQRPFLVTTADHITTKVLGTSFRIKSYGARKNIDVLVATGKVTVGNSRQVFATMTRGQQISYDKVNQRADVTEMAVPIAVKLVFDNITLKEVLTELEYAYSIHAELQDESLNHLKCEATFSTKQPLTEILDILCSLHHLKFKESDDHKTFKIYKL